MAVNQAHYNGGVVIHQGELILIYVDGVELKIKGESNLFASKKKGRLYLTSHRCVFTNKDPKDGLQSLSFPFYSMKQVELEQPVFGANYIKGNLQPIPGGGFDKLAEFELHFMHGGAVELGRAMLQAARLASRMPPPQYQPPPATGYFQPDPQRTWAAPPPYGFDGFQQAHESFPQQPPASQVWMTDAPPPYTSIFNDAASNGTNTQTTYYNASQPNQGYSQQQQPLLYPGLNGASSAPPGYGFVAGPSPTSQHPASSAPPAYDDAVYKKKN